MLANELSEDAGVFWCDELASGVIVPAPDPRRFAHLLWISQGHVIPYGVADFHGTARDYEFTFGDHQIADKLRRSGGTIECGGVIYTWRSHRDLPSEFVHLELPAFRGCSYLCQDDDGAFYALTLDIYRQTSASCRLFVDGQPFTLHQVSFFAEGRVMATTPSGYEFYCPLTPGRRYSAHWRGQPLHQLDPRDFVVHETDSSATVTPL